jgi:uncharacterized protein
MRILIILIILLFQFYLAFSQEFSGTWNGVINTSNTSFEVRLQFSQNGKTIDGILFNPELCIITDSCYDDSVLQLKSTKNRIEFKGQVTSNKNKMSGVFKYKGQAYPIDLYRGEKEILRPQEPHKPYPYKSEEIYFTNEIDSTVLAGTLTIPDSIGIFPAVILISGSSPSDRDGNAFHHKRFLVLADHLTRSGIAVLRYDSRGVNKSAGNFFESTPLDFAQDVIAGFNYLSSRKDINNLQIGLIGHSLGGVVASIVASQNTRIGFIVLLGTPGLKLKHVFRKQHESMFITGDFNKEQFEFHKRFNDVCYEFIEQGVDMQTASDSLGIFKESFLRLFSTSSNSMLNNIKRDIRFQNLVYQSLCSHNHFAIKCDPSIYLENVKCPVLALNGSKDMQVSANENFKAIEIALKKAKNEDYTILEMEGLNHTFQECEIGSFKEAINIEQTISPKVLMEITDWIVLHTK